MFATSAIAPPLQCHRFHVTIPDRLRVVKPHEVQLVEIGAMGSDWSSHCFSDWAAQQNWH
ncbi:MAG: hypothetical protein AB1589_22430 [Cyanobacteriota bacterium]